MVIKPRALTENTLLIFLEDEKEIKCNNHGSQKNNRDVPGRAQDMCNGNLSRRRFLELAGFGKTAMTLPLQGLLAEKSRKPNVIVILPDGHGYAAMG